MEEQQTRQASDPMRHVFRAVTVALPILFLLFLELALRLVGFGGSYPLFVDALDAPGILHANDRVIQRYYSLAPELAIDTIYFKKKKSPESYRIVVQGASTAAGFPYGRWGGLAGMLGHRLETTFPDREIEVISTALAAVNSYTLLDLVDEIIEIEPDAVLIYAGHNEYVGILGIGSGLRASGIRPAVLLQLELRKLRCYQLLDQLILAGKGWFGAALGSGTRVAEPSRGTLMARAASGASAPYESELYHRGIAQLHANLSAILQKYQNAGIPVYIGTLASNEKDQKPFASVVSDRVDADQWKRNWQTIREARRLGDLDSARAALRMQLNMDNDVADVWYALGEVEHAAGRLNAARDAFRTARDRDSLRFRAPDVFNQRIRQLAGEFGAKLVDVQKHLSDASPDGILGEELFLEHVHPNAEGYFLLADAYYQALKEDGEIGDWSRAPSRRRDMRFMPITALDRALAKYAVHELKSTYPFREAGNQLPVPEPSNEIEQLALQFHRGELDWLHSMDSLLQISRSAGRIETASVVARITAQTLPAQSAPNLTAGMLLKNLGRFVLARKYLDRSLLVDPESVATLAALIPTNIALGDIEQARIHFLKLRSIDPSHPQVLAYSKLQP